MVIALVGQIGSPAIINMNPVANAQELFQQLLTLHPRQGRPLKELPAAHHILVFQEQSFPDDWLRGTTETGAQDCAIVSPGADQGSYNDIGVHDDPCPHRPMIAHVLSSSYTVPRARRRAGCCDSTSTELQQKSEPRAAFPPAAQCVWIR